LERKSKIDATGALVLIIFMAVLGLNQVCIWRGSKIDTKKAVLLPGIAIGICFAIEFALLFKAIEYTTVARTSVLR